MALFRIPSKKVQYGYVEVDINMDGLKPSEVAVAYMDYVADFQLAEIQYVEDKMAELKASAPQDFPEADEPSVPSAEELANISMMIAEPSESEAVDNIVNGLGATEVPDVEAPWNKTAAKAAVTEDKKPWEVDTPVAAFDWS